MMDDWSFNLIFELLIIGFNTWAHLQVICKQWRKNLQRNKKSFFAPLILNFSHPRLLPNASDVICIQNLNYNDDDQHQLELRHLLLSCSNLLHLSISYNGYQDVVLPSYVLPSTLVSFRLRNTESCSFKLESHSNLKFLELIDVRSINIYDFERLPELEMLRLESCDEFEFQSKNYEDYNNKWPKLKKVIFDDSRLVTFSCFRLKRYFLENCPQLRKFKILATKNEKQYWHLLLLEFGFIISFTNINSHIWLIAKKEKNIKNKKNKLI
jgi:hypothetical protein